MIDLTDLLQSIIPQLINYTEIPQLIDVNEATELLTPRITYQITNFYTPEKGFPVLTRETVPSSDPNFEKDILITESKTPRVTVSFTVIGPKSANPDLFIQKAREWLDTRELGKEFLDAYRVVVAELTAITDRGSSAEGEKLGFDATFQLEELVSTRVSTIEDIVQTFNCN